MDNLGESIKKLLLAGVGAAVTTAEKSKEILDDLVEKGALTVEQGRTINEELKHNIKETVREYTKTEQKENKEEKEAAGNEDVLKAVSKMTPDELSALREYLKLENEKKKMNDKSDEDKA